MKAMMMAEYGLQKLRRAGAASGLRRALTVCLLACGLIVMIPDVMGQGGMPVPGMPGGVPAPGPGVPSPSPGIVPGSGATAAAPSRPSASAKRSKTAADRARGVYSARDPFWPIGYKPKVIPLKTDGAKQPAKSEWEQAEELIQSKKTGTARGRDGKLRILVNGQVARVGQKVTVDFRGRTYVWHVTSIGKSKKGKISMELKKLGVR